MKNLFLVGFIICKTTKPSWGKFKEEMNQYSTGGLIDKDNKESIGISHTDYCEPSGGGGKKKMNNTKDIIIKTSNTSKDVAEKSSMYLT